MTDEVRAVLMAARVRGGFLSDVQVSALATDPQCRVRLLLVRLHEGRLLVPVQDAARVIAALEAGGLSVRDVSLPAGQWPEARA